MISGGPSPVRSATATPGHTRWPLGARHFSAPVAPLSATTSYAPHTTSGEPSGSRSATAGDAYHPVWQKLVQPPRCHLSTGALICATARPGTKESAAASAARWMAADVGRMRAYPAPFEGVARVTGVTALDA